jgi:hypothetical protein
MSVDDFLRLLSSSDVAPQQVVVVPLNLKERRIVVHICSKWEHSRKASLARELFFMVHNDAYFVLGQLLLACELLHLLEVLKLHTFLFFYTSLE